MLTVRAVNRLHARVKQAVCFPMLRGADPEAFQPPKGSETSAPAVDVLILRMPAWAFSRNVLVVRIVAEQSGCQTVARPIAQCQGVIEILGRLHHQDRTHGFFLH